MLLLAELDDCIPAAGTENVEERAEARDLSRTIDRFLTTLKEEDMVYFVRRYWHGESVKQVAKRYGASEGKVKMRLSRTRKKMKAYLQERGFST
jgi:RNA polymerase sigma-70 factor (ECF subfamily)